MKSLHLNVKGIYFNQAKSGEKKEEYRLYNKHWKKKLLNPDGSPKEFKYIQYKLGYPKSDDKEKILTFPYNGFHVIEDLVHEHFDNVPTKVFAINLMAETATCKS